jgi:hypothetical protein
MTWKNEKRALKRAQWEAESIAAEQEQNRRNNLSMWERIEEFVEDEELKTILHALAEKTGLET